MEFFSPWAVGCTGITMPDSRHTAKVTHDVLKAHTLAGKATKTVDHPRVEEGGVYASVYTRETEGAP